jgi:hypothetical protein
MILLVLDHCHNRGERRRTIPLNSAEVESPANWRIEKQVEECVCFRKFGRIDIVLEPAQHFGHASAKDALPPPLAFFFPLFSGWVTASAAVRNNTITTGAQDTGVSGRGRVVVEAIVEYLFESVEDHGGLVRSLKDESLQFVDDALPLLPRRRHRLRRQRAPGK